MKSTWILLCCAITVAAYSIGADDGSISTGVFFALITWAVLSVVYATFRFICRLLISQGQRRV